MFLVLRRKIAAIDKDYSSVNAKVEFWSSYRDKGAHEHKQQVSNISKLIFTMLF